MTVTLPLPFRASRSLEPGNALLGEAGVTLEVVGLDFEDDIRAAWRQAKEADVPALAASVAAWRGALWKTVKVDSYVAAVWHAAADTPFLESESRQAVVDQPASDSVTFRVPVTPEPGQSEVAIHLAAREPAAFKALVEQAQAALK